MPDPLALSRALKNPALVPGAPLIDPGVSPIEGNYLDIPVRISNFQEWDSVQSVQAAINSHEYGIMFSSALLADSMSRDDRIMAVMRTYINGVLGLPNIIKGAGGDKPTARAIKVAEFVKHEWPTMIPQAQLTKWIFYGEMLGLGIGELTWTKTSSKWVPQLKVHNNQFVYWDWGDRVYKLTTMQGVVNLQPGDSHWALYMPGGYQYGWMVGLIRQLWMQWLIRQFAYRDWARYSEVHGLPIRGAVMPAESTDEEKRSFLQDIAMCGAETAIGLKQSKDGDKFDLKLIEAVGRSEESFDKLLQRSEESIAIRILGQNLSTQIRGGSFAAATAHENVRQDIKEAFASTVETDIKEQILKPTTLYNFGDAELTPEQCWDTKPPADKSADASRMDVAATALVNFRAAGLAVDKVKFCEKFEIPIDPKYPDGELPPEKMMDPNQQGVPLPRRVPPNPPKT